MPETNLRLRQRKITVVGSWLSWSSLRSTFWLNCSRHSSKDKITHTNHHQIMSPNLKYIFSAMIPALGWGYWLWEEDREVAKKCGKIGAIAFAVGFLFSMCTGLIGR